MCVWCRHVGNLMFHLGDERTYRSDWATEKEIVERVGGGYDASVEEAGRKKVDEEVKRREKGEKQRRERQREKAKLAEAKQEL